MAGKPFIKAEAEEVLAALSKDDESLKLREPHETQKKIFMKAGSLKCFADGGPDSDQVLDNVDKKYTNEESLWPSAFTAARLRDAFWPAHPEDVPTFAVLSHTHDEQTRPAAVARLLPHLTVHDCEFVYLKIVRLAPHWLVPEPALALANDVPRRFLQPVARICESCNVVLTPKATKSSDLWTLAGHEKAIVQTFVCRQCHCVFEGCWRFTTASRNVGGQREGRTLAGQPTTYFHVRGGIAMSIDFMDAVNMQLVHQRSSFEGIARAYNDRSRSNPIKETFIIEAWFIYSADRHLGTDNGEITWTFQEFVLIICSTTDPR